MKIVLHIVRANRGIDASAEYDSESKNIVVRKGSIVSNDIAHTPTFRGASSIKKYRANTVKGNIVIKDVVFKSASTAANYVTGTSTNGLTAWKDEKGKTLKELIKE